MIKVMHVLNTGKYSGAENVVITLINATKANVDATYVSLDGEIRDYLSENDIKFEAIDKLVVQEIKRVIKRVHPDIIHAHDFTAGIICSAATSIPVINHLHNNSPWLRRYNLRGVVYGMSCLRYKKILTVSEAVMNEYVLGGMFKKKNVVVGNPVDVNRIRGLASVENVITEEYDIAFLGRLSAAKNPLFFLDIVKEIKKKIPGIRVIMIGDGELKEDIVRKIESDNLEPNINLVGFQKNPYNFLKHAKILLMPSAWEGYGLAAAEALALGVPVVCSNVGGLPQIVDESCGQICSQLEEYCDAIICLLMNEEMYKDKVVCAKDKANKIGDVEKYADRIEKTYREIMLKGNV